MPNLDKIMDICLVCYVQSKSFTRKNVTKLKIQYHAASHSFFAKLASPTKINEKSKLSTTGFSNHTHQPLSKSSSQTPGPSAQVHHISFYRIHLTYVKTNEKKRLFLCKERALVNFAANRLQESIAKFR